jgi:spermidine synthase
MITRIFAIDEEEMQPRPGNIIHSEFFNNHLVEIVDDKDQRSLYFAGDILQSRMSLIAPQELLLFYTRYMMSALLVQPEPAHVLLIGIGAGGLVRFLHHHFPRCEIDAVDNLPQIIRMAISFFQMPDKAPIALHCCDGFEFLAARTQGKLYDLILVDAFDEKGMSKSIYTAEFFRLCQVSLVPGGVLSCNLWSGSSEELAEVKNEIQGHSTSQIYLPVQDRGNIVALAFNTSLPWEKINRPKNDLKALSDHFRINFTRIVKIAIQQNLSLSQRMGLYFR